MSETPHRGARRPNERGKWNTKNTAGRMLDTRKAWANMPKFDLIMFVGSDNINSNQDFDPDLPPVRIEVRMPGRRNPTIISLTHMTEQELNVFGEFVSHAIETARPICVELDRRAQEAFDNGDDGFERLYRPLPQFVDRERGIKKHGESVPGGPEGSAIERNDPAEYPQSDNDRDSGSGTPDGTSSDIQPEYGQ